MRLLSAFLCTIALSATLFAQQKYLVSPNQEVIPVPPASSARALLNNQHRHGLPSSFIQCDPHPQFGYIPPECPICPGTFGFSHGDVMGEWFVAPARGTIDTIYIVSNGTISTLDSTVRVRIFKSNIGPGHGPGYDYPSPCLSWGYWINTTNLESGISAFIEDATDTTWHSTADSNGSAKPSFTPFGSSLWGMGGVTLKLKPYAAVALPMDLLPGGFQIGPHPPEVTGAIDVGETFFFSMQMPSFSTPHPYPEAQPTQFPASYMWDIPGRAWKFYPHENGPDPGCYGTPGLTGYKGWWARGSSDGGNPTRALAFDIWYSMTLTANVPPVIFAGVPPGNTLSTDSRSISAEAIDCDYENPSRAGLDSVFARYTVTDFAGNVGSYGTILLDNIGGDSYSGMLPGVLKGSIVKYKFFAVDSAGLADSTSEFQYKVIDLNSSYYKADMTLPCTTMSIAASGTVIDTSAWFLPPRSLNTAKGDDGTSGPFSLGGPFVYFGDTLHYAWIGVNGAIALSKAASETLDVNSNGYATYGWDFPQRQYHGRSDAAGQDAGLMPKNLIAPFWAEWIVRRDAPPMTFGHVRYSSTAYPGKFVVEWDSLGDFDASGAVVDNDRFRVVLDRLSGSIQFQYDNVGIGGLDTLGLVGIQSDSLTHPVPVTPFNLFNRAGSPTETRPRAGLCVSYYPCDYSLGMIDGWNLVAICTNPPSRSRRFLFPSAVSPAFVYNGGYAPIDSLSPGRGYWLKFSGAQSTCIPGSPLECVDDSVNAGWNIIGCATRPTPTGTITSTPPAIIVSPFFGFNGSYTVASMVSPGHGYWVRCSAPGKLHICGGAASSSKEAAQADELSALDKVTIQDNTGRAQTLYIGSDAVMGADEAGKYEMPPAAPDESFGVRFSSGRLVEVYPATPDKSKEYEYPILLRDVQYPIGVSWEFGERSKGTLTLIAGRGTERKTLTLLGGTKGGTGSVRIIDPAVTKLILKLTQGVALPKEFALSQNYPNPFNPITQFIVDVPKASDVEIAVYDILGREIVTLMRGEQDAGYHTVDWDSKDSRGLTVPSGMYMVRMTAGDFSASRKVLLLK